MFVTLLFVVGAVCMTASILLTRAFIGSEDRLAAFVPSSAAVYVHADSRAGADALLAASPAIPAGVQPRESAFVVLAGGGTGSTYALLSWLPGAPNADERARLSDRGAQELAPGQFFIGDSDALRIVRDAVTGRVTVADDREKRTALAAVRALARVQLFVDVSSLRTDDPGMDALRQAATPFVAGVNRHGTSLVATVLPLEVAAGAPKTLGYATPPEPSGNGPSLPAGAPMAVRGQTPPFDVVRLVGATETGPALGDLATAADRLRESLDTPYGLVLFTSADGAAGYLARFPRLAPAVALDALDRFAAVAKPTPVTFPLPDGGTATELRILPPPARSSDPSTIQSVELSAGANAVVSGDGSGGSLLASDQAFIESYRTTPVSHAATPTCGQGDASLRVIDPAALLSMYPRVRDFVGALQLKELVIHENVDKGLVLCGYRF